MIILGVDPSTTCTGYSIFDDKELIECGKLVLQSEFQSERLYQLQQKLEYVFKSNRIDIVCVETQFVGVNSKTSLVTAMSKGIVIAMARKYNCRIIEFAPMSIKKAITNVGNSKKKEVAEHIVKLFPNNRNVELLGEFSDKQTKNKEKNDDIFDAIAIGYSYYILGEFDDKNKSREV